MLSIFNKILDRFKLLPIYYKVIVVLMFISIIFVILLNAALTEEITSNKWIGLLLEFSSLQIGLLLFLAVAIIILLVFIPLKNSPLKVAKVRRLNEADKSSRVIEITLVNDSYSQIILDEFDVKWKYYPGMCCSIAQGTAIHPIAKYIITLPVDVFDESEIQKSKRIDIDPTIVIPPRNNSGPSITILKVQFHYEILGEVNYHPQIDWNIYFDLSIIDSSRREVNVFKGNVWRTDEDFQRCYNGEETVDLENLYK